MIADGHSQSADRLAGYYDDQQQRRRDLRRVHAARPPAPDPHRRADQGGAAALGDRRHRRRPGDQQHRARARQRPLPPLGGRGDVARHVEGVPRERAADRARQGLGEPAPVRQAAVQPGPLRPRAERALRPRRALGPRRPAAARLAADRVRGRRPHDRARRAAGSPSAASACPTSPCRPRCRRARTTASTFCILYGSREPFSDAELLQRYPDRASYVAKMDAAIRQSVEAGYLLPEDAVQLCREARLAQLGWPKAAPAGDDAPCPYETLPAAPSGGRVAAAARDGGARAAGGARLREPAASCGSGCGEGCARRRSSSTASASGSLRGEAAARADRPARPAEGRGPRGDRRADDEGPDARADAAVPDVLESLRTCAVSSRCSRSRSPRRRMPHPAICGSRCCPTGRT